MNQADLTERAASRYDDGLSSFMSVRPRLFGIAYRMLRCAAEAEDVVQDVWVRWQSAVRSQVRDAEAFLVTTATRLAINVMQSARSRRETSVGPWLTEPVGTSTDGEFVVVMDIAGMDPKDIAVFTDGSILRISGVRKDLSTQGRRQFHALEIQVGPFQRLIGIPVPIEPNSLTNRYANGLLEIRLKKKGDGPSRRRIDVK